jgi:NADPH-dependent ferric siderophore reductase
VSSTLADRVRAKVVPRSVRVVEVERIGARLIVVTISAPAAGWAEPGATIAVRVAPRAWRRYTVSSTSADAMSMIAVVNQHGPAGAWLTALRIGDAVTIRGPERPGCPPLATRRVAAVGDETAIGSFVALSRTCAHLHGVVVTDDASAVRAVLPQAVTVSKAPAALDRWAAVHGQDVHAVALGERSLVRDARRRARAHGITSADSTMRIYWQLGRAGLE